MLGVDVSLCICWDGVTFLGEKDDEHCALSCMHVLNAMGKNYCMAHLTLGLNMWRGLGKLDDGNLWLKVIWGNFIQSCSRKGTNTEDSVLLKGDRMWHPPKIKYFYFCVLEIYLCFWQIQIWKIFAIYGNSEFRI